MTLRNSFGEMLEAIDDHAIDRPSAPSLATLWSRRTFLRASSSVALLAGTSTSLLALGGCEKAPTGFDFTELKRGVDETHRVAEGHGADILIRWGDPVTADAPAFDPANQTAEAQSRQFGYNNDYLGFIPLPFGKANSDHGLLCVNHEYTNANLMFAGFSDVKELSP